MFVAWWMLHVLAAALRFASFQRLYNILERGSPKTGRASASEEDILSSIQVNVLLVRGAAAWCIFRPTCLQRSLTLWWLLRRQGIACALRIGVRFVAGRFEAHAWVERLGLVLNDRPDIGQLFAPFATRSWSPT